MRSVLEVTKCDRQSSGVAPEPLSDFRAGETELPATAWDRLIETFGLRLMQEIPR
jgi:hypothetical protein